MALTLRQLALLVLLMLPPSASSAADEQPSVATKGPARTVKFAGGETVIDTDRGSDHVVVDDGHGKVLLESWCDSGAFDSYVTLFNRLRDAVAQGDRNAVTKLAGYPLHVNAKKPLVFRNEASLLKAYDSVFTPQVSDKIHRAEPAAVFCRNGEGMLGDGVVWARASKGMAKLAVVNQ
jgi:hypothetical protein